MSQKTQKLTKQQIKEYIIFIAKQTYIQNLQQSKRLSIYQSLQQSRQIQNQKPIDLTLSQMNQQRQQGLIIQYKNHKPLKWWQKVLKRRHHYSQLPDRKIITNAADEMLQDNSIQTSKYNLITFIPLNLLQQFTKPSNIYFLLIGIFQIIPQITISQGKPTMFLPLSIVVAVSMIKDFVQDWKRHKNDQKQNQEEILVVTEIGFIKRKWQSIKVGEIIKVKKDQYFPCDVLILQHSQQAKVAYVETKNLDGENNLKLKLVPDCLASQFTDDCLQLSNLRYQITYEKPNPFLNVFNGNIKVGQKKHILDNSNLILRGCSLKINEYVIGLCLYNGHESKILLNSISLKPKRSYVQKYLYSYFKYIFAFQMIVTLISAIAYGLLLASGYSNYTYFGQGPNFVLDTLYTWGSWFISFSNFIPISLLVTLEVVRFGQGKILAKDKKCSSAGNYAEVQTSSVNDDLGQIQYILSDKTGTMTKNQMDFKCIYVNGVSYGHNQLKTDILAHQIISTGDQNIKLPRSKHLLDLDLQSNTNRQTLLQRQSPKKGIYEDSIDQQSEVQKNIRKNSFESERTKQMLSSFRIKTQNVDFSLSQKKRLLSDLSEQKSQQIIKLSLLHLSLCHNVICQQQTYTSSSPDEVALTSFSKFIGYRFIRKNDKGQLQIQEILPGKKTSILKYILLHTLQFSSERKRMSVIVKQTTPNGRILLLTKGADDVILRKLNKHSSNNNQKHISDAQMQLFNYACQGLRTLVLVYKQLSPEQYNIWDEKYSKALAIVSAQRYDRIADLQTQIEQQLNFVAVTAIQDKLQDEVKETISQLKKSNIKVWMLTGDKKQTAISIGYSCGLIDPLNEVITFDCQPQHAKSLIKNVSQMLPLIIPDKVTVLSGEFITLLDQQAKTLLNEILKHSVSVICCRVSPKGKSEITSIVKQWGHTLAIGDGANDVNMINSAHVGVGVRGIEGSQATRAADYVLSEFRMLRRLVLFYGINFYHRNTGVVLFTLYKNILITFPILCYGPLSIESATYIYETWIFQFFNVFFVALPIIYFGLFDTIYSQRQLTICPYLYKQGQQKKYLTRGILVRQIISTIVMSIFIVFTSYYITNFSLLSNGFVGYQQFCGMLIFNTVIVTANIRIWNMSHQFNLFQFLLCTFGILSYYLLTYIIQALFYLDVRNTLSHQTHSWIYWVLIILYAFVLEGVYFIGNRFNYINIKKQQFLTKRKYNLQQEIIKHRRQTIHLEDISQDKRNAIGGYAFAQAEQRSQIFN